MFIFQQILNNIDSGATKLITDTSANSVDIFSQDTVTSLLNFFQMLGWIIVAVGVLFGIANFCISQAEGNYVPIEELFKNIMYTIIAAYFIEPGAIFIFTITNTVAAAIKGIINISASDTAIISELSATIQGYGVLMALIFTIVFLVALFIVFLQATKRSGMYVLQIMVGYIYLFALPGGNTEGIAEWCRQTAALAATNILQMSALIISLNLILKGQFFPSLAMLFAAASAEKIAGRFGLSAGSRQTLGGAARGISSLVQTVRMVGR